MLTKKEETGPYSQREKDRATRLVSMYDKSYQEDATWRSSWEDINRYVQPAKGMQRQTRTQEGQEAHFQLYDGSVEHYNEIHASALHSRLTSVADQWWALSSGDPKVDREPAVRAYFQAVEEKGHEIINGTNFHSEVHEMFLDLGGPGTSVFFMWEDDDEVMRYETQPINRFTAWEDNKKMLTGIGWMEEKTGRQILMEYDKFPFDEESRKELTDKIDKKLEIIRLIMPREETKLRGLGATSFPFASYHIWKKRKLLLSEGGYREFPVAIPRYTKIAGEKYGRSPAWKSMPDVRMLNECARLTIMAGQQQVMPPTLITEESVMGALDLTPAGVTVVRQGIQNPVVPFMLAGSPQFGFDMMEAMRTRLKENFLVDKLQLKDGPQMTATEVNVRADDSLQLFSPILGRFGYEFLGTHTARLYGVMGRKGMLPDLPDALSGINLKVRFTSQMARVLQINKAVNVQRFVGSVAPIFEADQTALDNLNVDVYVQRNATWYGVPQDMLTTDEERAQIRQERQQAAQKAQQQQDSMMESEVARNAAPAIEASNKVV